MSTKLVATTRDRVGSRQSQKLRAEGRIPAALQAEGAKPQLSLSIDEEEFMTARRHHEHVYLLALPSESTSVLVDELHGTPSASASCTSSSAASTWPRRRASRSSWCSSATRSRAWSTTW